MNKKKQKQREKQAQKQHYTMYPSHEFYDVIKKYRRIVGSIEEK